MTSIGPVVQGHRSTRPVTLGGGASRVRQALAAAETAEALGDLSAAISVLLATLVDRLGLFTTLAEEGPATQQQRAEGREQHSLVRQAVFRLPPSSAPECSFTCGCAAMR